MRIRETLGSIFINLDFADLFPHDGAPTITPARLVLMTMMQFAKSLADHQAADTVCAQIDWKYALALDLTDPNFDASVLCASRVLLAAGGEGQRHTLVGDTYHP